jgi:hypothetical protein
MGEWRRWSRIDGWSVIARQAKAKLAESGMPDKDRHIADFVQATTGKNSKRALVNMWLRGEREPYLSQFFALCSYLKIDPASALGFTDSGSSEKQRQTAPQVRSLQRFPPMIGRPDKRNKSSAIADRKRRRA